MYVCYICYVFINKKSISKEVDLRSHGKAEKLLSETLAASLEISFVVSYVAAKLFVLLWPVKQTNLTICTWYCFIRFPLLLSLYSKENGKASNCCASTSFHSYHSLQLTFAMVAVVVVGFQATPDYSYYAYSVLCNETQLEEDSGFSVELSRQLLKKPRATIEAALRVRIIVMIIAIIILIMKIVIIIIIIIFL